MASSMQVRNLVCHGTTAWFFFSTCHPFVTLILSLDFVLDPQAHQTSIECLSAQGSVHRGMLPLGDPFDAKMTGIFTNQSWQLPRWIHKVARTFRHTSSSYPAFSKVYFFLWQDWGNIVPKGIHGPPVRKRR